MKFPAIIAKIGKGGKMELSKGIVGIPQPCLHKRIGLRDWQPDSIFTSEYLICLDCSCHLLYIPHDLTQIINIPHPPLEDCPHTHKHHLLTGFGRWICLNCGHSEISVPKTKLHIRTEQRDFSP